MQPRTVIICLAALVASLTACSSVGQPQPGATPGGKTGDNLGQPAPANVKDGGTLTVGLDSDPDHLDPTLSRSLVSRQVFHAMCEKLYDVNDKVALVPQLAAGLPETGEDGLTVTIPLREGVKFADGTAFNAEAVKKTIERHLSHKESSRVSELGPIDSVEAKDEKTVVIHLKKPFAPLPSVLADRAGMIMSPKALGAKGKEFGADPVCVGPYKFEARTPQSSIDLVKDPEYYDADKAHYDKITYRIITDNGIRSANLQSGDINVATRVSTEDVPKLEQDAGIEVLRSAGLGYQGITFNVGNVDGVGKDPKKIGEPFADDPRVRIAFEHAIDRKALVKTVFRDMHATACSPIAPPTDFTSDRAQQCREHDPAKAKQLLKDAGVTTPYKMKMAVTNTPVNLRLVQTIQAMAKEGGFDIEIEPAEFASLLDQQDQGKFESLQIGWSGRIDADGNITTFIGTKASQNVSGYSNKEIDGLLDKAREELDPTARAQTYGQMVDALQKDNPLVYLYRETNLTGVGKKVGGVQVFADGIMRVAFAGDLP